MSAGKKEQFIPFSKHDLVNVCLKESPLTQNDQERFKVFCRLLQSIYHFEFHQKLEQLKSAYRPVDPDSDLRTLPRNNSQTSNTTISDQLDDLLTKANYSKITENELQQAMTQESLFKIRLHVDFNDFEEVLLYFRGESRKQETIKLFFGLIKKDIEFSNFERVVLYIKFKDTADTSQTAMPLSEPGSTVLKLFRNVPKADLEMLFPNTQVRMKLQDKLLIGVPAAASGGIILTTKLGSTLLLISSLVGFWLGQNSEPIELDQTALLGLLAGLGALGGYLWKQFSNFKNRKLKFLQTLTENLYFKNLDNNAGVFHRLIDDAEEEEFKEAILAYYFLLIAEMPLTSEQLDTRIETWFADNCHCHLDFDITDALQKLLELGLITSQEEQFTVMSLDEGFTHLDNLWDNYFNPAS